MDKLSNQTVWSDDVDLNVRGRPGSPTVLFLHGLAGHGGEWIPVIEHLDAAAGVIAPDQRAHGASFHPTQTCDLGREAFVADGIRLIEAFADEPIVVVGQSMGGIAALLIAHARPDLVKHLVLVEAGISAMTEDDLAGLRQWFESWPQSFADADEAMDFFGRDAPSTPAWVSGLERSAHGLTARFRIEEMMEAIRSLGLTNRSSEWQALTIPATLISAANGFLDAAELADMKALRPTTTVVTVDDAGHDVHLDQPVTVARLIAAVLTTN